jgi:hypothetical protein
MPVRTLAAVLIASLSLLLSGSDKQDKPVTAPTTVPQAPATAVRLTNGDIVGLSAICRIVENEEGTLVTLSSGAELDLDDPVGVETLHAGLARLEEAGRVRLFRPVDGVVINLAQVTTIWLQDGQLTLWGFDGTGWRMEGEPQTSAAWRRLAGIVDAEPAYPAQLARLTPEVLVNLSQLDHVKEMDGELRLMMANGSWPTLTADQAEAARRLLNRVSAVGTY